jgi:hypothetical protein
MKYFHTLKSLKYVSYSTLITIFEEDFYIMQGKKVTRPIDKLLNKKGKNVL